MNCLKFPPNEHEYPSSHALLKNNIYILLNIFKINSKLLVSFNMFLTTTYKLVIILVMNIEINN